MARPSKYGINIKDSGIYLIKNLYNGKVYIGSAKCLISRLSNHLFLLKNNKHHSKHLQSAWNKYGENMFIFGVIEIIKNIDDLVSIEQNYINKYKSFDDKYGYNICPLAKNNLGSKHQRGIEDKKRRMSGSGNNFYNKKHSPEAKRLIGLHNHKRKLSNNDVKKIRFLYENNNIKQTILANMYNVDPSHISDIVNYKKRLILYDNE